ncbi:MAG TPA: hypothetical protein VJ323_01885, partial [Bryobacteraceae bacterium]|nr:hypothetical protein [Bryobacteraceae bacterium]
MYGYPGNRGSNCEGNGRLHAASDQSLVEYTADCRSSGWLGLGFGHIRRKLLPQVFQSLLDIQVTETRVDLCSDGIAR